MSLSKGRGLLTYSLYGMTLTLLVACLLPIWRVCYVGSWEIIVKSGMLWEVIAASPDFIGLALRSSDPNYFFKLYFPNLITAAIVLTAGGIIGMFAWILRQRGRSARWSSSSIDQR